MDTLASLVFGIVVISAIKDMGVTKPSEISRLSILAGILAAAGLAFVYISLSFIGATSPDAIGVRENGGAIISAAAQHLYGPFGTIILALIIALACITTSVGLVSSCSEFFSEIFPRFSYRSNVIAFSLFSMLIANIGLTQLIQFSLPVLVIIYPLAILLIALSFLHEWFGGYSSVYVGALVGTGFISIFDGLKAANLSLESIELLLSYLPLQAQGLGWIVPAILGGIIGYLFKEKRKAS
jgi:LIVCS family branched-chain amino acid:cation transporter